VTPDEIQALLRRQAQQLDDLEHTVTDLRATSNPPAGPAQDQAAPFLYSSLPEFVEAVIAPLYAKHGTSGGGWCTSWWAHEEARVRLGAIWRAWETLRLDPSIGIARWLRDVADPQMDRLRDPDQGPFTACGDRHLLPDPRFHWSRPPPASGSTYRPDPDTPCCIFQASSSLTSPTADTAGLVAGRRRARSGRAREASR